MADLYEIKQQTTSASAGEVLTTDILVAKAGKFVTGIVKDAVTSAAVTAAPVLLIGDDTNIIAQTLSADSLAATPGRYLLGISSLTGTYTVEVSTNIYRG